MLFAACSGGPPPYGWSSATISDQTVYFGGSNSKLYALDAGNGSRKWEFAGETGHPIGGIYGQPVLDKSTADKPTVYFGAYLGTNDGQFFALDASNGSTIRWKFPQQGTLGAGIVPGPLLYNGVIYFGANDGNFYALNAADGTLKWKFATGAKIWSTATADDQTIYFGGLDHFLYALNLDGSKKWAFDAGGIIVGKPLVTNSTIYFGALDMLYALNLDGTKKWASKLDDNQWIWSSPTLQGNLLYFGDLGGKVYAFDATAGTQKWVQSFSPGAISSSIAVTDTVGYFGSENLKLYAIDLDSGNQKWQKPFEALGAIYATPAVYGDVVYVGSHANSFYAVGAADGAQKWCFDLSKDAPCAPAQ